MEIDFVKCPKCFSKNWNDIPNIEDKNKPKLNGYVVDMLSLLVVVVNVKLIRRGCRLLELMTKVVKNHFISFSAKDVKELMVFYWVRFNEK